MYHPMQDHSTPSPLLRIHEITTPNKMSWRERAIIAAAITPIPKPHFFMFPFNLHAASYRIEVVSTRLFILFHVYHIYIHPPNAYLSSTYYT